MQLGAVVISQELWTEKVLPKHIFPSMQAESLLCIQACIYKCLDVALQGHFIIPYTGLNSVFSCQIFFLPLVFKQWKNSSIRDACGKNPFTEIQMYLMGSSLSGREWGFGALCVFGVSCLLGLVLGVFFVSECKGTKLDYQQKSREPFSTCWGDDAVGPFWRVCKTDHLSFKQLMTSSVWQLQAVYTAPRHV